MEAAGGKNRVKTIQGGYGYNQLLEAEMDMKKQLFEINMVEKAAGG